MTKHIAKHAFKSGVLPKPRRPVPRVNAPFEQEALDSIPAGFSDPNMVPKGSVANPPGKKEKSAAYKIAHSAKEPTNMKSKTPQQEWKSLSAKVRRVYLSDVLQAEEKRESKRAAHRQALHEEAKEAREKLDKVEDSEATKLTLPSIDQSLLFDGPMVRGRSEEETRELKLKRKANMVTTKLDQATLRDKSLLSLYQHSLDYIITEEELNAAVDLAFSSAGSPLSSSSRPASQIVAKLTGHESTVSASSANLKSAPLASRKIHAALTGTIPQNLVNDLPAFGFAGLEEVKDSVGEDRGHQ